MEVDDDFPFAQNNSPDLEEGELIEEQKESTASDEERKVRRAKRFGIPQPAVAMATESSDPQIAALHRRMGIDSSTRTEALHLLGTDNMKTEDVFSYFDVCPPASIEWISDNSCNAFWLDDEACAKALLMKSIHIKGQDEKGDNDLEEQEESIHMRDVRMTLPSGIWRKGRTFALAPNLFMRYAKYTDRKTAKQPPDYLRKPKVFLDEGDEVAKKLRVESSNPWVDIALQWGHYEHKSAAQKAVFEAIPIMPIRDARDLISSRDARDPVAPRDARDVLTNRDDHRDSRKHKKHHRNKGSGKSGSDDSRDDNIIGRMHADIEEEKILSQKSSSREKNIDLRDKLGRKRKHGRDDYRSKLEEEIKIGLKLAKEQKASKGWESSSDSEDADLRKRLQRPSSKCKKKLRIKKEKQDKSFVHSPLRIEIDNDIYYDSVKD